MELEGRRNRPRPAPDVGGATVGFGSAWNWELEIAAAIAMVARDPRYRVVLCGGAWTGGALAELDKTAAGAGVVLERQIRRGGGWDVEVRAA
jgi:hypothetical protein